MKPASSSVGNRNSRNVMTGIGCALVTSSDEMKIYNEPIANGSLIYNRTTGQLSVGDGKTNLSALPDHKHPGLAHIGHSHITSANEIWRVGEPRLWYVDDLHNHPELIPLDGREIPNDQAEYLRKVYPGSTLLTHPCKRMSVAAQGFENDFMSLSVSEFQGDFLGSRIVNDEITKATMLVYTDQWLTNSVDVNKSQSVTINFLHGNTYSPNEYWMIPAAGIHDAPLRARPTPRDWKLEGSNNNGTTWELIDEKSDIGPETWQPLTIRTFKISTISDAYSTIRLTITKWNGVAGDPLETGLRRFWIFGNKSGVFTMPELETPSDAFTWVVPCRDLDVGLSHEEIGDVGMTASLPEHTPGYRVRANGQSLFRASYPELFNYIGFTQDKLVSLTAIMSNSGSTLPGDIWEDQIVDTHDAKYIEIVPQLNNDEAIGAYSIVQSNTNDPLAWILEGSNDGGNSYEPVHTVLGTTVEDLKHQKYTFYLDKTLTDKKYLKYRITFTQWATMNASSTIAVKLYAHKHDEFYVPDLTVPGATSCFPYIVANNTAKDVSSEVVANLQKNVANLLREVARLQAKVMELDPKFK